MTEDDIRLAAEALGVIPRSKTRPKSLEVPPGGLSQAQRQTQQTLSEGIKSAAERREAEESEAWGKKVEETTTPSEKIRGGLEAAVALPSGAAMGILGQLGEGFKLLPPGGANKFVAENTFLPRTEAGQRYFDVWAGGVENAAEAFGETPMGEFLGAAFEKVPGIFPVSGAATKAVDEGIMGAGKGLKLAAEQARKQRQYETGQEGAFYRVRPVTEETGRAPRGNKEEAGGGAETPGGPVRGDVPQPITDDALTEVMAKPDNFVRSVASDYAQQVNGRPYELPEMAPSSLLKQAPIGRAFDLAVSDDPKYKKSVFEAYGNQMPEVIKQSGAKNYDQLVEAAYRQLAKETDDQFRRLPVNMSYHRAGEGNYSDSRDMLRDVYGNRHLYVFQGGDPHPFMSRVDPETGLNDNEKFRAVHDFFGHAIHGNQFGPKGEETAWLAHSQMYSPLARLAMSTETRGQNSVVNYTPLNAKLKAKLSEIEGRIYEARRRGQTDDLKELQDIKKGLFGQFEFAPQYGLLLPPEMIRPDFAGKMPDYVRPLIQPAPGTATGARLFHYGKEPGIKVTDPSRYGTGIKGAEASRLEGAEDIRPRTYFYTDPTKRPEAGLGPYRYTGEADLYNLEEDPLALRTLAAESLRSPFTAKVNPGMVDPGEAITATERLVKEYGYPGYMTPESGTAAVFQPVPVQQYAEGGAVTEEDDPGRLQRLINLYQAGLLSLDDLTEEMRGMHPYDVATIFGGTDSNPLMRVKPGDIERMPFTPEQQEEAMIPEGLDLDDLARMDEGETEEEFKFRGTPNIRRLDREPKPADLNQPGEVYLAPGGAVTMAKGGKVAKGMSGISAAREAMKAQRREERVQKNLETYMGSTEKPQTYYHATQAPKDFRKFDLEKRPTPKSAAAVFLTPSTDWANEFDMASMETLESATSAAPRIMPMITRAKNTFDYENPEHVEAVMKTAKFPKRSNPFGPTPAPLPLDHIQEQISLGNWNFIEDRNIQKAIKDLGFDSFNIKEKGVKNLGVFNPADVKALFNRGSYDPTTADISKAAGGPVLKGIAKARAEAKMAAGGKAREVDRALSGIAAARAAQKAQRANKLEEALEAKQPPMTTPQGTGLPLMPRDQGMYIPGVKQEDLPRMTKVDKARAAGKRPEYTERMEDLLQSRAAKKKVDTLIEKGDALGMREWYGIEPLRQVAMDIGMSPQKFNEFIAQMASASQRNPVDQQNRMGSYLWHLSQTGGLPSNAFLYTNKMRRGKQGLPEGTPIELPSGYGSLAQGDIFNRGLQIARGDIEGALPPDKKLGTFYRNYLGNLRPVTVDVNAVRGPIIERGDPRWLASKLVEKDEEGNVTGTYFPRKAVQSGLMSIKQAKERPGFWEAAPSGSEYAGFEDLWQSAAKRFGIQPAEAQALGWYGSADVTALKTKPELYIDNLERMIRRTAEQTGKNPRQVMEDMLRGTEYLRKKGGLVRS